MRILLSGGGTWGSVTALLALVDELRQANGNEEFLWVGTKGGSERLLVENWQVPFRSIFSGKLRRYFSWWNFIDPLFILIGFFQSIFILKKFKPDRVLTAGSFVAVPVVLASRLLKIPVLVHQQDLSWGLANRIMRPFAAWLTVNLEPSFKNLSRCLRKKAHLTGNPTRQQIKALLDNSKDRELILKKFSLESGVPVVLVLGGGTGAMRLNEIVAEAMPRLYAFCQVLHLTGKEKKINPPVGEWNSRYHWQESVFDMSDAYNVADLVISRAGLGTLTELAVLGKVSLIVPIPGTHQEENAKYFVDRKAVIVLNQNELTTDLLSQTVKNALFNQEDREVLAANIGKIANLEAGKEIVDLIKK
ncbi:MAG: UDP-N-acetylglucosamine--N-acetylmuramyl-(pentapeptide) pyrophosphoryl-undecaprenol N-acetylglucosamine transferase [bacterium]|nr:UDP-N-acetylglucosamine--N-acetylmuramyl-(pentapeptide) pyrophosphoryl-undecaprenol N-acetylglucosamine transferase [bacterium]